MVHRMYNAMYSTKNHKKRKANHLHNSSLGNAYDITGSRVRFYLIKQSNWMLHDITCIQCVP